VDERLRALLPITLQHPATAIVAQWDVWVDTAFTGDLTAPRPLLATLHFPTAMAVEAILADGSRVKVNTYQAMVEWFGKQRLVEIVASDGEAPLLGLGLLKERKLSIDFAARTVTLD
jgi:clan AA aspartic protease